MNMEMMDKLKDGFCEVLHKYAGDGFRSAADVETAKAALSGLTKIKMLEGMEREESYSGRGYRDGYSERGYRDSSRRSFRRYHDSGYSGHEAKEKMMDKLEMMYDNASGDEKKVLDEWMAKLK